MKIEQLGDLTKNESLCIELTLLSHGLLLDLESHFSNDSKRHGRGMDRKNTEKIA